MSLKNHLGRLATRAAAGIVATAALASCGGGTYQVSKFTPSRLISFGDESSKLVGSQGLKYSINGVDSSNNIDCSINPLWNQRLASQYGLVFQNCNSDASIIVAATDETTIDATVDDVVNQVRAFEAGDAFGGGDLVTVWVGVHDVIEEYQTNGTGDDESVPVGNMTAAGATLAGIVNEITAKGAKVILLTIPDMSLSPYGYTEAQRGDFDRAKLLSDMSTAFNLSLRSNIVNDGSRIGLVTVDDYVRGAVKSPGSYGYISLPNQSFGCNTITAPLPNCTTLTLTNDPSTGLAATANYLWADSTHLGSAAQTYLGNQAANRATSNPF